MKEDVMILSELSQGHRPLVEGISWFGGLSIDEQRRVIRELAVFILQAGATSEEADKSIRLAGVKLTATPAVLLSRGPLREGLAKVSNLPEAEMENSFRILISLLSLADARRRSVECAGGCGHPWHNLDAS
jgi:hypothetical protein